MKYPIIALAIATSTLGVNSAPLQANPKFGVLQRISIPGDEGWDYLTFNESSHRLFISRGNRVAVLDVNTGKIVGEIPNTSGVHGIAIDEKLKKGYISDGRDNSVTVFDLKTLAVTKVVPVGQNPDAIIFDPKTAKILTMNGRSNDVTVIDPSLDVVVGTIKVSGKPEFAASDLKGNVFVNIEDKSCIEKLSISALKSEASYPLAPGEEPTGMAIDRKAGQLFSVCGNAIATTIDLKTGKLLSSAKIGKGADAAAFDPVLGLVFSSNGQDGTVTVLSRGKGGKLEPIQEVTTQRSARTMTLDASSHKLYLIAADFEAVPGQRRGRLKPGSAVILVVGVTP